MQPLEAEDPRTIGEYRLLGRLGAGGMGRVYLGRSPGGRTVAVKVVHPHFAVDEEFRTRFRREIDSARRVGSVPSAPGSAPVEWTAPVLDADPGASVPWVATGYIAGPSLQQAVAEHGPLPEASVRALGAGLAEALAAVHGLGLVHRDVKPSNVLLTLDGPRLIDFGIARAMEGTAALTSSGVSIGSPGYMSPEQVLGRGVGTPSDMFSLGAVLAYAATAASPFPGDSSAALLYKVVHEEPELDGLAGALREVIADCLAKDAAERPAPAAVTDRLAGAGGARGLVRAGWLPGPIVEQVSRRAVELLHLEPEAPGAPENTGNPETPANPGEPHSGLVPFTHSAEAPAGGPQPASAPASAAAGEGGEPRAAATSAPAPGTASAPGPAPAPGRASGAAAGSGPEASGASSGEGAGQGAAGHADGGGPGRAGIFGPPDPSYGDGLSGAARQASGSVPAQGGPMASGRDAAAPAGQPARRGLFRRGGGRPGRLSVSASAAAGPAETGPQPGVRVPPPPPGRPGRQLSCTLVLSVAGALAAVLITSTFLFDLLPGTSGGEQNHAGDAQPDSSEQPDDSHSEAADAPPDEVPEEFLGTWRGKLTMDSGLPNGTLTVTITEGEAGDRIATGKVTLLGLSCPGSWKLTGATDEKLETDASGSGDKAGCSNGGEREVFTLKENGSLRYESHDPAGGNAAGTLTKVK